MLSKNRIKFIHSLERKKEREESGCFVAEGNKWVVDSLSAFDCKFLVSTADWAAENAIPPAVEWVEATAEEMRKISFLKSPQDVLAVFYIPQHNTPQLRFDTHLVLALDRVQDPGNLGTIVRLADWYGIEDIFCSLDCADLYNPKVVQATMGAIARVKVHYVSLPSFFEGLPANTPVYGTFLNGDNIYEKQLTPNGVIVMGNEGSGISDLLESYISDRLYLPPFSASRATSESLNVAIATAVVCAEFRRIAML